MAVGRAGYPCRVVTALYRRYRPETFAELIGQSQVTKPLRTALRTNRVNHAYLFSGPRGCGKTTSARILARCLNCAQGPTDTPCGVCPSCIELARDGGGSLDVIEIDAASHNGVDDARDLRDRAIFAPARDRYKIFILDEAHMVTPQGFNALLKLVEEPPEHVKFVFATTEPEKVIGTIRSRTHHYPFRLVPPATMLEYVEQLCEQESVSVAPGVLPLVVRAGGGSVRDTLSLLDQLMAGSDERSIAYDRAVALLGYTDGALIDDVVDALAVSDPASAFTAIDRVIQTGQDPRRFVEDLLERLRDLIIVAATNDSAGAVLRGISPEELTTMSRQAAVFGAVGLSRAADIANRALTEMTGATSPRLHLELMVARMLVPESDDSQRGALARVERLERRVGVEGAAPAGRTDSAGAAAPLAARSASADIVAPGSVAEAANAEAPVEQPVTHGRSSLRGAPNGSAPSDGAQRGPAQSDSAPNGPAQSGSGQNEAESKAGGAAEAAAASWAAVSADPAPAPVRALDLQQIRDSWAQVVEHVQRVRRSAWTVVVTAQVSGFSGDILTLTFPSQQDVASFKEQSEPGTNVSELLRAAILDVLGVRVKFVAKGPAPAGSGAAAPARPTAAAGSPAPSTSSAGSAAPARSTSPADSSSPAGPTASAASPEAPVAGSAGAHPSVATAAATSPDATRAAPDSVPGPVTDWAVAAIPTGESALAPDQAPVSEPAPASPVSEPVPASPVAVGATPANDHDPDVPIDDYPLDDEPYDAGPAPSSPARPAPPAPFVAAPATTPSAAARPATPQVPGRTKRPPVPGRYGEAVVREILGAQFIEETALDDGRRS